MNDLAMLLAARLRERGARCREMARLATSRGIAGELDTIATEYERDAAQIEAGDQNFFLWGASHHA